MLGSKFLIIGTGSIAMKHKTHLARMGGNIAFVSESGRNIDSTCYVNISEAIINFKPDYIIVANATHLHLHALQQILSAAFEGRILVEKPLFAHLNDQIFIKDELINRIFVNYQLRFHPLIQALKNYSRNRKPLSIQAYVGQDLSQWRERDYSKTYSAHSSQGGGVLRDLSHEFDYLQFIFGEWQEVVANCNRLSSLNIDSDDTAQLLISLESCTNVSVELNYTCKVKSRYCLISYDDSLVKIDFVKNSICINDEQYLVTESDTELWRAMYNDFITRSKNTLCTCEEALNTLALIKASEKSLATKSWVSNKYTDISVAVYS